MGEMCDSCSRAGSLSMSSERYRLRGSCSVDNSRGTLRSRPMQSEIAAAKKRILVQRGRTTANRKAIPDVDEARQHKRLVGYFVASLLCSGSIATAAIPNIAD